MQRKVLMTKEKGCVWTWLLENGEAAEIHCSRQDEHSGPVLGNVYIGKVQNIMTSVRQSMRSLQENKVKKKRSASEMSLLYRSAVKQ